MDTQRFAGCSWSILPWSRCWSCWVSLRFLVSDCCGVWAVFCCGILFYRISLAQLRLLNCAVVVGNPEPKNLLLIMPWWLWSGLACLRKSLFLNHCSVVSHGDPPQKKAAGLQDSDQSKVKLDARVTDKDPRFENFFFRFLFQNGKNRSFCHDASSHMLVWGPAGWEEVSGAWQEGAWAAWAISSWRKSQCVWPFGSSTCWTCWCWWWGGCRGAGRASSRSSRSCEEDASQLMCRWSDVSWLNFWFQND